MHKYPRTQHLEGSRLQPGDEDLSAVPFGELSGRPIVVEEKLDGANAGISFGADGRLQLQSRGHYLVGGARERHFALFKTWASVHQDALRDRLGERYVVYGEWLYAKHTVFYDRLPHWFMEFDVLDTASGAFLDTPGRRALLAGLPVVPVPVLWQGPARSMDQLWSLIAPSLYKGSGWREALVQAAVAEGLDPARVQRQTDPHDDAEGLYIKWEDQGRVLGRYKLIRPSFLSSVMDADGHWLNRPILPNRLADGVDIYRETP